MPPQHHWTGKRRAGKLVPSRMAPTTPPTTPPTIAPVLLPPPDLGAAPAGEGEAVVGLGEGEAGVGLGLGDVACPERPTPDELTPAAVQHNQCKARSEDCKDLRQGSLDKVLKAATPDHGALGDVPEPGLTSLQQHLDNNA